MKNWPGRPTSPPSLRSTSSVYAPTASTRSTTSRRAGSANDMRFLDNGLGVQILKRHRRHRLRLGDRLDGRGRTGQRRDAGDVVADRGLADLVAVGACSPAEWGVDHQVDDAAADYVVHCGRAH